MWVLGELAQIMRHLPGVNIMKVYEQLALHALACKRFPFSAMRSSALLRFMSLYLSDTEFITSFETETRAIPSKKMCLVVNQRFTDRAGNTTENTHLFVVRPCMCHTISVKAVKGTTQTNAWYRVRSDLIRMLLTTIESDQD